MEMLDYMRGLQQAFFKKPDCRELHAEIEQLYQELAALLEKGERRKLLRLLDTMHELRDRIALANFIAGFRLAAGIAAELGTEKPYSFDEAEEKRGAATCAF